MIRLRELREARGLSVLHHFSPCRHVPQHALAALLRAPRAAGCPVSAHLGRAWDTKKRPPPPQR
jgi:hypothetical protein